MTHEISPWSIYEPAAAEVKREQKQTPLNNLHRKRKSEKLYSFRQHTPAKDAATTLENGKQQFITLCDELVMIKFLQEVIHAEQSVVTKVPRIQAFLPIFPASQFRLPAIMRERREFIIDNIGAHVAREKAKCPNPFDDQRLIARRPRRSRVEKRSGTSAIVLLNHQY